MRIARAELTWRRIFSQTIEILMPLNEGQEVRLIDMWCVDLTTSAMRYISKKNYPATIIEPRK